jgi:hypothetical protein
MNTTEINAANVNNAVLGVNCLPEQEYPFQANN